jgi:AcrR family transcriptional regulator
MTSERVALSSENAAGPVSIKRIRDAALRLFAVHGTEATSLRTIAQAAGVSVGLVQHHFTTKDNLIDAVNDYVMTVLGESVAAPVSWAPADPVAEVAQRVTWLIADHVEVIDYLCRALVERTPIGVRVFDGLVETGTAHWEQLRQQGLTRADLDPLWSAINPLILVISTLMLRSRLSRHLPEAFTTPTQLQRWQNATEALIGHGQLRNLPTKPTATRTEPQTTPSS